MRGAFKKSGLNLAGPAVDPPRGGAKREVNTLNKAMFTLSDTMAEPQGYLAVTQSLKGNIQLVTSKDPYTFNLTWVKALPAAPKK